MTNKSESEIQAGDVVRLRSGHGPKMTVEYVYTLIGRPGARCTWFLEDGETIQQHEIAVAALVKIDS